MRTHSRVSFAAAAMLVAILALAFTTWLTLHPTETPIAAPHLETATEVIESTGGSSGAEVPLATRGDPAPIEAPSHAPIPPLAPSLSALRLRVVDTAGVAVPGAKIVLRMVGPPGAKSNVVRGATDVFGVFAQAEMALARGHVGPASPLRCRARG